MPKIHLNLFEFIKANSNLTIEVKEGWLPGIGNHMESYLTWYLCDGQKRIGGFASYFSEETDRKLITLRSEYWDEYLPEITRIAELYEKATNLIVVIEPYG